MNVNFNISPSPSEMAAKFHDLAHNGIWDALGRAADSIDDFFLAAIIAEAPRRSGDFASQIHAEQEDSGSGGKRLKYIGPDPLASWILNGTPPHVIEPINPKGYLAFMAADGQFVFAKHVDHPGTQPNDFVSRAYNSIHGDLLSVMRQIGQDIIDQVT